MSIFQASGSDITLSEYIGEKIVLLGEGGGQIDSWPTGLSGHFNDTHGQK